jgi:hypothetical protein
MITNTAATKAMKFLHYENMDNSPTKVADAHCYKAFTPFTSHSRSCPVVAATLASGEDIIRETEAVLIRSMKLTNMFVSDDDEEDLICGVTMPDIGSMQSFMETLDSMTTSAQDSADLVDLEDLGSRLHTKAEGYMDVSFLPPSPLPESSQGKLELFPHRLHRILGDLEKKGMSKIASFLPHGRAFLIWEKERFVKDILPQYFGTAKKYSSFTRQLNLYGFLRVLTGPDEGAYYHPLFLQGREDLCRYMTRVGTPKGGDDRRRSSYRKASSAHYDPDFYAMAPVILRQGY